MKRTFSILGAAAIGLCGCARPQIASPDLAAARDAYDEAHDGDAARLAPEKLYHARKALDRAEREHEENPGSEREKQLGYIAKRLAETSMAYARLARARQDLAEQRDRFELVRRVATERELAQTKSQLSDEIYASGELERDLDATEKKLEREEAARKDAEREAAMLQHTLDELAKLQRSSRGVTLSLSGSVLFEFGKSQLLPTATRVLDEVAEALKDQEAERTIVVEGHTDSVGNDTANQALSQARAEAVRSYLVQRGIHPGRIKAVGKGEAEPVTKNESPEGRAQNRRVEIHIGERR
jgi:outer membrane protein OmpA-like peptidoglycan-associated protein